MSNKTIPTVAVDTAAGVKAFCLQNGISAEVFINAVSTDEHGRRWPTGVDLGAGRALGKANNEGAMTQWVSRVNQAVATKASQRWQSGMAKRAATLKADLLSALEQEMARRRRDAQQPYGRFLRHLVDYCDAEVRVLEKTRSEAQARLRQVESELAPLQSQISTALKSGQRPILSRFIDLVAEAMRFVDRGLGLAGTVLDSERLISEREARTFDVDAATHALSVLLELRGTAQAERDRLAQFTSRLHVVQRRLTEAGAVTRARLAAHPYADVDLTSPHLLEHFDERIQVEPFSDDLSLLMPLDEQQLYDQLHGMALARVGDQLKPVSLLDVMEIEAAALATQGAAQSDAADVDLAAETLDATYQRTADTMLALERRAVPRETRLVGVADESNTPFHFEGATLVGIERRDQIQMAHLQTGITLDEVSAYTAYQGPFELAARRRNYYVLDTLALDDHARLVFALALASGLVEAREGLLVILVNGAAQPLGATVEGALDQFVQHDDLIAAAEATFNRLSLAAQIERLSAYLSRGQSEHITDDLWWEFAGYVEERLKLAREQAMFVSTPAPAVLPAAAPSQTPPAPDGTGGREDTQTLAA